MSLYEDKPLTREEVRACLLAIPAPQKGTNCRTWWLKICAAVCSALNGNETEAIALLSEWSPPWEKNAYENAIRSFHRCYKSHAGTPVEEARKNGFDVYAERGRSAGQGNRKASRRLTNVPRVSVSAKREERKAFVPLAIERGVCSIAYPDGRGAVRTPPQRITVEELVEGIRSGRWRREVEAVRAGTREKKSLPNALVFGVYEGGIRDECLMSASGYAVADFDFGGKNESKDFGELREKLLRRDFVASCWTSAGGAGMKALVRLPRVVVENRTDAADGAKWFVFHALRPLGFWLDVSPRAVAGTFVSFDESAPALRDGRQRMG